MRIKEQLQMWQDKVEALEKQVRELTELTGRQAEVITEIVQSSRVLTQITQETNKNIVALLQQQLGD